MVIALLALSALAQEPPRHEIVDLDGPASGDDAAIALSGNRIRGFGGAHGVALDEQIVVGGDGGIAVTTVTARMRYDAVSVDVRLPFASYITANGRDTDLGNLQIEGRYQLDRGPGFDHAVGLALTLNPGGTPYTWANRIDEVWPGGGVDGLWEVRSTEFGSTTVLGRGSLGIHGTRGYEPVPALFARIEGAVGVDQAIGEVAGFTAEASLAYWDIAPFELAAFLRADPVEGLRVRGGLVLPLFTWFGWEPTGRPGGVREATLALSLTAAI